MTKEQFQLHCQMQAAWWIAYATTGACKNRKLFHGTLEGTPFTDEEKVEDAFKTAQRHIQLFRESCES